MNNDDMEEAWLHVKNNAGKTLRTATMLRDGGMKLTERWIPITRRSRWDEDVNNWFDEMDELYSAD